MALVRCPDCSNFLSDIAPVCVYCGRPSALSLETRRRRRRALARAVSFVGVGLVCAGVLHEVQRAHALGVPTLTPLAYSGSLLTFGAPDNSVHSMQLGLFVVGANDGGIGSAACTTTASVTCANGQFTIPLSASCESVVQQNPNLQVEVTVDNVSMGLVSLTAVPYAIEAGTAASVGATNVTGVLPVPSGGTGSSTQNFVDLSSAQTIGGAKAFSSPISVQGGVEFPNGSLQTEASNVISTSHSRIDVEFGFFSNPAGLGTSGNCTASPCTLSNTTPGVASLTRSSTGQYVINFVSGTFSATPTCTYSVSAWNTNYGGVAFTTVANTNAIGFQTANSYSSVLYDSQGTFICTGTTNN